MGNNKRNGLTLIEVILAMLILSTLLITYVTIFGQSATLIGGGNKLTRDTFEYQELMENSMVEEKQVFIQSNRPGDYNIEIFKNHDEYKAIIDTKEILVETDGSHQFKGYVTNHEIEEPKAPKITLFELGVYKTKDNSMKKVFPWFEDDIEIVANFTLEENPKIYENRLRWYESEEDIFNPVFSSDFTIIDEIIQKEPNPRRYTEKLKKENNKLKSNKFYYFESRPYTLAGRLNHFRNEERILILNREGSSDWQKFMEEIYFNKAKIFDINNKDIYLDIMQNPNKPTLNLDWSENKDPVGALVGIKIPTEYKYKDFKTNIEFKFEENPNIEPNIGIGLVNENNYGLMINISPFKNLIIFNEISNDKEKNKKLYKISDLIEGELDWSKEGKLNIEYFNEDKIKINFENNGKVSDIIELVLSDNLKSITPKYIGLKSYSNVDYMPDLKYEISNKHDRNYSSHFYNIKFEKLQGEKDGSEEGWINGDEYYYNGNSHTMEGNKKPNLKIKLTRKNSKLAGSRKEFVAKGFWFSMEILELDLKNHPLIIKSEEVKFDVPIELDEGARGIEVSGINANSYPVKVSFREGERLRINGGSIITLKKGEYISIDSGFLKITGEKNINSINGSDFKIIKN